MLDDISLSHYLLFDAIHKPARASYMPEGMVWDMWNLGELTAGA
jgi:hypothetical protein